MTSNDYPQNELLAAPPALETASVNGLVFSLSWLLVFPLVFVLTKRIEITATTAFTIHGVCSGILSYLLLVLYRKFLLARFKRKRLRRFLLIMSRCYGELTDCYIDVEENLTAIREAKRLVGNSHMAQIFEIKKLVLSQYAFEKYSLCDPEVAKKIAFQLQTIVEDV